MIDDGGGNQFARHRCRVQTVSAEAARHPRARPQHADLRHAMNRIAHDAGPRMFDRNALQVRKDPRNVTRQFFPEVPRRPCPRADPPAPEQPPAGDAIIIARPPRVGDGAAITNRLRQLVRDRLGRTHISGDRQDGAREHGKAVADECAAAEHDILRTHAAALGRDPFPYAFEIRADCRRLFENPAAAFLDFRGQREREIERMNGKGVGIVQRLIVALGLQRFAHALRLPDEHFMTEMLGKIIRLAPRAVEIVITLHIEPARHRIDAGNALCQHRTDQVHPLPRQRIKRFRLIETDPLDDTGEPFGVARRNDAAVPPRCPARHRPGFQHHDVIAAPDECAGRPQSGKAPADDANACIDILRKPRARFVRNRRRCEVGVRVLACHRLICIHCHARLWSIRSCESPNLRTVARTPCAD
jgi:hypothetical protein